MRAFFLITFCLLTVSIYGQSRRSYDVEDFTRLDIGGPYYVTLKRGSNPQVELSGDSRIIDYTTVKIEGRELIVKFENRNWRWGNSERVDVTITFEELESLDVGGACNLRTEDAIEAGSFDMDISGASDVELELEARDLRVDVSGASSLELSGEVTEQDVDLSGASSYKARDFVTRECYIEASGASNGTIYVRERLKARANGASSVYYYGDPEYVDSNSSGAGSVKRRS